jgi:hypothetical protein
MIYRWRWGEPICRYREFVASPYLFSLPGCEFDGLSVSPVLESGFCDSRVPLGRVIFFSLVPGGTSNEVSHTNAALASCYQATVSPDLFICLDHHEVDGIRRLASFMGWPADPHLGLAFPLAVSSKRMPICHSQRRQLSKYEKRPATNNHTPFVNCKSELDPNLISPAGNKRQLPLLINQITSYNSDS